MQLHGEKIRDFGHFDQTFRSLPDPHEQSDVPRRAPQALSSVTGANFLTGVVTAKSNSKFNCC